MKLYSRIRQSSRWTDYESVGKWLPITTSRLHLASLARTLDDREPNMAHSFEVQLIGDCCDFIIDLPEPVYP